MFTKFSSKFKKNRLFVNKAKKMFKNYYFTQFMFENKC